MANDVTTTINHLTFTELADTTDRSIAERFKTDDGLKEVKSLYDVESIPNGTGTQRIYTSYDADSYANRMAESEDAQLNKSVQGKSKTMYMYRFGKNSTVSHIAKNFSNSNDTVNKLRALTKYIPNRMALDMTHRFTFASSTSYTDLDGEPVDTTIGDDTLAVISASQTLTASSSTVSNVITGNPLFSKGSFEVAKNVAKACSVDEFNVPITMDFNTVVTANEATTIDSVAVLKRSTADPTSSNSGVINSHKGGFRHVVLPKLDTDANGAYDTTKEKRWFWMAAGTGVEYATFKLGIWEAAHGVAQDVDIKNDDITLGTRGAWGICVVDFRGVTMSTGLGA
jgi:hypothetical protein